MDNFTEIDTLTLNNGKSYIVTDQIVIENDTYLFLNNENDYSDFCIKKLIPNNNEELQGIETKEEFNRVLNAFLEKNKDLLKEE